MEIRAAAGGVTETDGRVAGAGSDLASSKATAMDNARIRRTAIRLELQDAPRWKWRYRRHLWQQLGFVAWGGEGRERLGNEHLRQAPVWRHLEPLKVARLRLAAEAPAFKRAEANRQRWLSSATKTARSRSQGARRIRRPGSLWSDGDEMDLSDQAEATRN